MKSKNQIIIIEANKKGYEVINGDVFYKGKEVKKRIANTGYYTFCIRVNKDRCVVVVHRLVAFQKYGKKIFKKGIQVRHLDSNPLNNNSDNIVIGTPSDNNMDKNESVRMKAALIATSFVRKHNHDEIIKMHNKGLTYKQIMKELNIKSTGTISFIINKSIALKKTKKTD